MDSTVEYTFLNLRIESSQDPEDIGMWRHWNGLGNIAEGSETPEACWNSCANSLVGKGLAAQTWEPDCECPALMQKPGTVVNVCSLHAEKAEKDRDLWSSLVT